MFASQYQASAGQSSCDSCDAGSYCGSTGLSAATGTCSKGSYSAAGASACSSCSSGRWVVFLKAVAIADMHADFFLVVVAGVFLSFRYQGSTGQSSCSTCQSGKYASSGASTCSDCEKGTYEASTGSSACNNCPGVCVCVCARVRAFALHRCELFPRVDLIYS